MPLPPDVIELIDLHRSHGSSYDSVHSKLSQAMSPDQATQVLAEYQTTQLPDGRERGIVNPGDPSEHGVV